MSAVDQVFNCTELLEHILSFIPPDKLLLPAQLACRRWRSVIQSSVKLQRCLYLKPDRSGQVFGLNPLLTKRLSFIRVPTGLLRIVPIEAWRDRLEACKTASWRRMLVAQPPEPFYISVGIQINSFSDETSCGIAWNTFMQGAQGTPSEC